MNFLPKLTLIFYLSCIHLTSFGFGRRLMYTVKKAKNYQDTPNVPGPEGRIVNGFPIGVDGSLPYQLALGVKGSPICGATLVDVYDLHIAITATHCVWIGWPHSNSLEKPKDLSVVAGKRLWSKWDKKREQYRYVDKIVIRESYDRNSLNHNVAILFLESNFNLTRWVDPLILAGFNWELPNTVRVSGWGRKALTDIDWQDELRAIDIPVTTRHDRCKKFNILPGIKITDYEFCAGRLGMSGQRQEICKGDSGGPAAAYNATLDDWYLAGIISYTIGQVCGSPWSPQVFQRVSAYSDWIRHEVGIYKNQHGR